MPLQVIFVESINNGVFQEKTNIVPEHKREDESVGKKLLLNHFLFLVKLLKE